MKPQDLWRAIWLLTNPTMGGGVHHLQVSKLWSISVNKEILKFIRFWYLNGAVPATYSIEQFKRMPVYEANDLLEKLRQFAQNL
jgi:hypothetical protein